MNNSKNNKGFSLVELIIVIAIMAVLMAVLAPTLLRYVEKSRLQSDNSAISEVAEAVKIALADEKVNNALSGTSDFSIALGTSVNFSGASGVVESEVGKTIPSFNLKSKTYSAGTTPSIVVNLDGSKIWHVYCENFIEETDGTGTSHEF